MEREQIFIPMAVNKYNGLTMISLIIGCVFAREPIAIIDFEGINVKSDEAKTLT